MISCVSRLQYFFFFFFKLRNEKKFSWISNSNHDILEQDFYIGRETGKGKPINNQSEKYRSQYHSFDTTRNIVPATKIKHNDWWLSIPNTVIVSQLFFYAEKCLIGKRIWIRARRALTLDVFVRACVRACVIAALISCYLSLGRLGKSFCGWETQCVLREFYDQGQHRWIVITRGRTNGSFAERWHTLITELSKLKIGSTVLPPR